MLYLALAALIAAIAVVFYGRQMARRRNAAGIATSMRSRGSQISLLLTRTVLRRYWLSLRSALASRERQKELKQRYHIEVAEEAAEMMGSMKGAFMKLGQILSFAHEGMPAPAREALARLQMDAPPMDYTLVEQVLRQELGDLDAHFQRVERDALAAASIGQVHRAWLKDGTEVVLKVQYPGVADAIENDLRASRGLAAMIGSVNKNIDAATVVQELKDRLFEELDYKHELQNQQLFYDLWKGHPLIRIPRVYPEHSGRHVICQQYCRGLNFHDFLKTATHDEKRLAIHIIHDFIFDSMNRHCLFNGDPHPGNYIFQEDGGITFIDFGCVKYFNPQFMQQLQALNRALMSDDKESFERLLTRMEVVLPGRPYDMEQLWEFFCYHSQPFRKNETFTFTKEWVNEAFSVMDPTKQTQINLPRNFVFLNRITFGLNSIMLLLEASENFYEIHRRYAYPDDNVPPSLTRLGIEVPERFMSARAEPIERASLPPGAPVSNAPPA